MAIAIVAFINVVTFAQTQPDPNPSTEACPGRGKLVDKITAAPTPSQPEKLAAAAELIRIAEDRNPGQCRTGARQ